MNSNPIDLTITITSIIAISAIISPIITTWLNNRHALKIKQIDFTLEIKKIEIDRISKIELAYYRSFAQLCNNPKLPSAINAYREAYYQMLAVAPKVVYSDLKTIDAYISTNQIEKAKILVENLPTKEAYISIEMP